MKKVFLILGLAALATGCSLNDDDSGQNVDYEFAKIVKAQLPDTLIVGNKYSFPITSEVSDCSTFYGFDARQQDSTIVVGVLNRVLENVNCGTAKDTISNDLNFQPLKENSYIFKFLTGFDAADKPIYLTKNVPVKARQ